MKWAAHKSTFMYCMKAIFVCCTLVVIRVLHNSKKHVSNALCVAWESVFLCTVYKLTAIFSREGLSHTMKKHSSKT